MWCELDLHHTDFEHVTFKEYDLITRAKARAKDAQIAARRVLNQELGLLVAHAFHNPKKMPDFTQSADRKAGGKADAAVGVEKLRAGLMGMHFKSKQRS